MNFVNDYETENMLQMFYKFLIILLPILSVILFFLGFKTIYYVFVRIIIHKKKIDINKLRSYYNLFLESNKLYFLLKNINDTNEIDYLIKRDNIDLLNPHNFNIDYNKFFDEDINYDGISIDNDDNISINSNDEEKCSICLSKIDNYIYTNLSCNHKFHLKCINEWLKNSNECPLCKRILL
jgi:hypothetical protein